MISFAEAAQSLERLCEEIDNLPQLDDAIQAEFKDTKEELSKQVDRRISYIKYAESQIDISKNMRDEWIARVRKFELMLQRLKANSLDVIKSNPGLPYKGSYGYLRAQKNSHPTLILDDEDFLLETTGYQKEKIELDKHAIKIDLENGIEIPGARLIYGEHLRIGVK